MRVIFFGTLGEFSRVTFTALLDGGLDVCGVMTPVIGFTDYDSIAPLVPLHQSPLPIVNPFTENSIVHAAWERQIPVYEVSRLYAPLTLATLSFLQPDVACVACFQKRIPNALLKLPRFGFLNLHPSLLPHYRGPHPLFWIFRNGEADTGVTVHFMDDGFDTGDIVTQAPLDLPDGISGNDADRLCAALSAQLMIEAIRALERGVMRRTKQPEEGSYYSAPTNDDFKIETDWPARRAFNFMRGTWEWGCPYPIVIDGERFALKRALSFTIDRRLDRAFLRSGDEIEIQFNPGVLRAQI